MNKRDLSDLVLEVVFNQCRHIWIPDYHYIKKGFHNVSKCLDCNRSSLTVYNGLAAVGNGHIQYSENVDVALSGLQKMVDMYSCNATIKAFNTHYSCSLSSKETTKRGSGKHKNLATAISLAMVNYLTGDIYDIQ